MQRAREQPDRRVAQREPTTEQAQRERAAVHGAETNPTPTPIPTPDPYPYPYP